MKSLASSNFPTLLSHFMINLLKRRQSERRHRSTLTDVVDGAGTELSIELLGSKAPEVMDGEGPEVENVVPREGVSLLDYHHFTAQQGQFNGCPQTTRTPANHQTLSKRDMVVGMLKEVLSISILVLFPSLLSYTVILTGL